MAFAIDAYGLFLAEALLFVLVLAASAPFGRPLTLSQLTWPVRYALECVLLVVTLPLGWRYRTTPGTAAMGLAVVAVETGPAPSFWRLAVRAAVAAPAAYLGAETAVRMFLMGVPDFAPSEEYIVDLGWRALPSVALLALYLPAFVGGRSAVDWLLGLRVERLSPATNSQHRLPRP